MRTDQPENIKRCIETYRLKASKQSKDEAVENFRWAYELAKDLGNPFTLRACAANLGAAYVCLGTKEDAEKGIKYLNEAIPSQGSDAASNGDIYYNIALGYQLMEQSRKAAKSFETAYEEYNKERDNVVMVLETLKRLVQENTKRQKEKENLKWLEKMQEIYADRPADTVRDFGIGWHMQRLAVMVQYITLKYETDKTVDEKLLSECLNLLETHVVQRQKCVNDNLKWMFEVAVMLTRIKEHEKAIKQLEAAQSLFDAEHNLSLERAVVLQNIGAVCTIQGELKKAAKSLKEAARIYQHLASQPSNPQSPIKPTSAEKCQGHCLASYAYALAKLNDLDEACVQYNKARDLAVKTGDLDTASLVDEALGAVYFGLAVRDLQVKRPLALSSQVALKPSTIELLHKSINWYHTAATDIARMQSPDSETSEMLLERVRNKCRLASCFLEKNRQVATKVEPHSKSQTTQEDDSDDDDCDCDDETEEEDDESAEDEKAEVDDDYNDKIRLKKAYRKHLNETQNKTVTFHQQNLRDKTKSEQVVSEESESDCTSEEDSESGVSVTSVEDAARQGNVQTHEDVDEEDEDDEEEEGHGGYTEKVQLEKQDEKKEKQDEKNICSEYSSSAEDDLSEGEVLNTDNVKSRKPRPPPLPIESPPVTMKASGTYELPRVHDNFDDGYDRVEGDFERPSTSTGTEPTGPYAEIDFDSKTGRQSASTHKPAVGKRHSVNHFLPTSEDDDDANTIASQNKAKLAARDSCFMKNFRCRKQSTSSSDTTHNENLYETIQPGKASAKPVSRNSSDTRDEDAEGGSRNVLESNNSKNSKDSKTCIIM